MQRLIAVILASLVLSLASSDVSAGQFYTVWDSPNSNSPGSAHGTLGTVDVTLSITNASLGGTGIYNPASSSGFGLFNTTQTVTDVYGPGLPGTNDFIGITDQSSTATTTVTFSTAVDNPIFYVHNVDFRQYHFNGGLTPTVLSGSLNLVASGSTVSTPDSTKYDYGSSGDSTKGNPNGSGYGSFQILGEFTSISWTKPLGAGGYFSDGNSLEISATVPEPSTFGLSLISIAFGAVFARRRSVQ